MPDPTLTVSESSILYYLYYYPKMFHKELKKHLGGKKVTQFYGKKIKKIIMFY